MVCIVYYHTVGMFVKLSKISVSKSKISVSKLQSAETQGVFWLVVFRYRKKKYDMTKIMPHSQNYEFILGIIPFRNLSR